MRWVAVAVALLLSTPPVLAEMDSADYASGQALSSPAERERAGAHIEAQRRAEIERKAAAQAEAEAARMRIEAERARRPYAERLLEARCGACHAPDSLADTRHTRPGWYLTVARMRFLNGAAISHDEAMALTAHLAREQPASRGGALLEYALVLLLPLMLGAGWFGWRQGRGSGM
jgi:cytochrome c5